MIQIKKFKKNEQGNAGIIAVLLMIIILCAGTSALVMLDKQNIKEDTSIQPVTTADEDSQPTQPEEEQKTPEVSMKLPVPTPSSGYSEVKSEGVLSEYACLLDVTDNTILAGKKYDEKVYPASLTKIMTLLVAVEQIDSNDNLSMDDKVTMTAELIDPLIAENASRVGFVAGEEVTVKDLIYGTILASGADAADALAIYVAGDKEKFVDLMNQKAQEFGLENTHFTNCTGLYDDNHYTTCLEMAMILKQTIANPFCKQVLSEFDYTTSKTDVNPNGIAITSTLFGRIYGDKEVPDAVVLGGKTGFIDESRHSLATFLSRDDRLYVLVTTNSDTKWSAIEDMSKIYTDYLPPALHPSIMDSSSAESKAEENSGNVENSENAEGSSKAE